MLTLREKITFSFDLKLDTKAKQNKMGSLVLFVLVLFVSSRQLDAFCGDRKLNGDLARSSVRAAEYIRFKVLDQTTFMRGHHHGAALFSLSLAGFSQDMLSRVGKEKLWNDIKTRNMSEVTPGEAGYYILGALATCQEPKDYERLVQRIKEGIPEYPEVGFNHPFPYGLAVLGLCMSGEGRELYPGYADKLVAFIKKSVNLHHAGDTMSMLTLALSCIHKDESLKNNQTIKTTLQDAAKTMVNSQKKDGSFGNSITTSLAVQALLTLKVDPNQWNCEKTMKFMLSTQASDGSFVHGYLMSVVQVISALIGAIPEDIKRIQCPIDPFDKPTAKIQVCVRLEFHTTNRSSNTIPKAPPPVHLTVDEGTNAHGILLLAAKVNPCYKVTTKIGAYGHSIMSICNVHRDRASKKYWMIYSAQNKSAGTGISSFRPKNGTCAIFKYRKLNF